MKLSLDIVYSMSKEIPWKVLINSKNEISKENNI